MPIVKRATSFTKNLEDYMVLWITDDGVPVTPVGNYGYIKATTLGLAAQKALSQFHNIKAVELYSPEIDKITKITLHYIEHKMVEIKGDYYPRKETRAFYIPAITVDVEEKREL